MNKLKEKIKLKKDNKRLEKHNKEIKFKDEVKFGEIVHQPPTITSFPKLRKKLNNQNNLTIPPNSSKIGITEKDRNEVIQRYRIMKTQGKFN